MKSLHLTGKKIYLRPLNKRDINQRYLSWLNDAQVTKYIESGRFTTTKKSLEDFYKRIKNSNTDAMFAIIAKTHDTHIGNIKLGGINWIHRYADLGIMIGEKEYWGRGYGQEACRLLLKYAFEKLNLNKVILGVYANHKSAIKAYKKAGFKIEGRIRKLLNFEGKYVDKVIMGVFKKDFLPSGKIKK